VNGAGPRGLDDAEAARRLRALGANTLPAPRGRGLLRIAAEVFEEPVFLLLVGAAILYIAIGDAAEGALLAGCAAVSVALVAVQSWRSERVLAALKAVIAPRARVLRGGLPRRIPAAEIVPGDVVVLAAGDRVPADGVLRQGAGILVDESALTGESLPVGKRVAMPTDDATAAAPGGDGTPFLFAGTLLLSGDGLAEIVATGPRSRIGAIGAALATVDWPTTPLQKALARLAHRLAIVALAIAALLAWLHYTRDGDPLAAILAGITVAMSAMPEELPMVLAIFLAVGAWRLSRQGVLARQPNAVLALGATTMLCVDKTGTITENQIRLARLALLAGDTPIIVDATTAIAEPRFAGLRAAALRACHPQGGDPMDLATMALGPSPAGEVLRAYPLTPEAPRVAFAWSATTGNLVIAAKGAPEAIARLCRLEAPELARLLACVDGFARDGLRVLAVAEATTATLPETPETLGTPGFALRGLLAFGDPVRDSARASIDSCRTAGIEVAMITGDYPATAAAIARAAGIPDGDRILIGSALAAMPDQTLRDAVAGTRLFARTEPAQKLRIVAAFQARGHVVAMTGDGVNDAPALRAAHVGVAMGSRGTDVAREAAGIVVLNDDLGSIVAAIRLGRRIADNLRKALGFIVAVHVPLVGLALLPLLLGWPPLLTPVLVIFLELVIDPTCAVVFEAQQEERDAMRRPPRAVRHTVASPRTLTMAAVQGGILLLAVLALYGWALGQGAALELARAQAFVALVAGTLALALTNLSWTRPAWARDTLRHPAFLIATGASTALLILILAWPAARGLFGFALPDAGALLGAVAAGLAATLWFEAVKRWVAAAPT
jgi:Ca2+-transporting ATPase